MRAELRYRGMIVNHKTSPVSSTYAAWLDSLPDSLQDSTAAEALRAICELDLSELQAIVPPRGFGRD